MEGPPKIKGPELTLIEGGKSKKREEEGQKGKGNETTAFEREMEAMDPFKKGSDDFIFNNPLDRENAPEDE